MQSNDRAKQFLPFDALKGFQEALLQAEQQFEEKRILGEDTCEMLNSQISKLQKGDTVTIRYYYGIEYIETTGVIKKIDFISKKIYLSYTKISFDDIVEIS